MASLSIERTINVPHEKVWAVAGNFLESPGPSITVVIEKEGDPEANGVGAERTITIGKAIARERLEAINSPNNFTYRMISGAPIKDYLGRAEFKPDGKCTMIKWTATFTPKFPGTGWIIGKVIKNVINAFIDELEKNK
ncbi:MAG: SRPBCC family protein [Firmicutes bacterium]|nr:SRPBCC family protein [Bacillota bacterium]